MVGEMGGVKGLLFVLTVCFWGRFFEDGLVGGGGFFGCLGAQNFRL